MAELLVEYAEPIGGEDGRRYRARACGGETPDGLWQGWVEFEPVNGGKPLRSGRETTQPNRADTYYWATGLTPVYLEGALHRALHPLQPRRAGAPRPPAFGEPHPGPAPAVAPTTETVLNPFTVYQKGEAHLRRQLAALSSWHLVNIIRGQQIATTGEDPNRLTPSALIDLIVADVRRRSEPPPTSPQR